MQGEPGSHVSPWSKPGGSHRSQLQPLFHARQSPMSSPASFQLLSLCPSPLQLDPSTARKVEQGGILFSGWLGWGERQKHLIGPDSGERAVSLLARRSTLTAQLKAAKLGMQLEAVPAGGIWKAKELVNDGRFYPSGTQRLDPGVWQHFHCKLPFLVIFSPVDDNPTKRRWPAGLHARSCQGMFCLVPGSFRNYSLARRGAYCHGLH